jgi:hypothetical protein
VSTLEGRAHHIKHTHMFKHACSQFEIKAPQSCFPLWSQELLTFDRVKKDSLKPLIQKYSCGNRIFCFTRASAGDIYRDAIYEVLTCSPMEIVGKCRLLSKEYNNLTYESLFTKLHSQRTNFVSSFLIQGMIRHEYHARGIQ